MVGVAGTLVASTEVRRGQLDAAAAIYRSLLPRWRRAGEWAVLSTMLRSVAELLAQRGRDEVAAVILGAVTAKGRGHEVFGADAHRLRQLADDIGGRIGPGPMAEALARGAGLDIETAAALAAAELD